MSNPFSNWTMEGVERYNTSRNARKPTPPLESTGRPDHHHHCPGCGSKLECSVCSGLLETENHKEGAAEKIRVRVIGRRKRLLDPDNFAGGCKYLIDCLRYAGLIPEDRSTDISLSTEQVKAQKGQEEKTDIVITYPPAESA